MNLLNRIAFLVTALTIGAAPLASAQGRPSPIAPTSPIDAKLVIPDTKVLPGVPFEMWIEVRNPSDATVVLGLCADMIVRPEGVEPFTISSFGEEERPAYPTLLPERSWNGAAVRNLLMRPHQTQTLTLPILPELDGPLYFEDERLSKPGRYGYLPPAGLLLLAGLHHPSEVVPASRVPRCRDDERGHGGADHPDRQSWQALWGACSAAPDIPRQFGDRGARLRSDFSPDDLDGRPSGQIPTFFDGR
jgi:hypothetical protein